MEQLALRKPYLGPGWLCYSRGRGFPGLHLEKRSMLPGQLSIWSACWLSCLFDMSQDLFGISSFPPLLNSAPMSIFSSVCSICPNHGPFGEALPLSRVLGLVKWCFGIPAMFTLGIPDSVLCSHLHISLLLWSGARLTANLQVSSAISAPWWLIPFSQVLTWTNLYSFPVCRWLSSLSNHPAPIHVSLPHSGSRDISAIRHLNQLPFWDFCFNHYYPSL